MVTQIQKMTKLSNLQPEHFKILNISMNLLKDEFVIEIVNKIICSLARVTHWGKIWAEKSNL